MDRLYNYLKAEAEKAPDKTAVIYASYKVSYHEFCRIVDTFSCYLQSRNITGEGIIVALPRGPYLLAVLFAIVRTGNYYIPIDLTYPELRIRYIVNHSKAAYGIVERKDAGKLSECNRIYLDELLEERDITPAPDNRTIPDNAAYCLYTSGSTGNPKGVLIPEAALINFIPAMLETIDFTGVRTVLCTTTQCFDIFFLESIMPLCIGLTVVLADDLTVRNPKSIINLMKYSNIDLIQMTPSRLQMILEIDPTLECLKNIKRILSGGERLSENLLKVLQNRTEAKIYNLYGPTETTIWSCVADLTERESVSIGKPIKNTQIYLLNGDMEEAGTEEAGEICIAGQGLAIGYIHAPELTKKQFIYWKDKIRIYRTGDYGKYDPELMEYVYLGRTDNQIKLNGHRIELEEIEGVVNQIGGIIQNVIIPYKEHNSEIIKLCCYYSAKESITENNIVSSLYRIVPEYMLPNKYIRVEQFPYTENGKIDRNGLKAQDTHTIVERTDDSDIRQEINEIILLVSGIEVNKDNKDVVFSMINSIDFISIIIKIEQKFSMQFEEEKLLVEQYPTLDSFYHYIEQRITKDMK